MLLKLAGIRRVYFLYVKR